MSHPNQLNVPFFNELTSCDEKASKWALSFCGCGFLGAYHIGVIACIREKHPNLMNHVSRIYGSSVGTVVAAVLMCGIDSKNALNFFQNIAESTVENRLGVFSLNCDICEVIRKNLIKELPPNIHEIASNKIYINVTCFPSMKSMIISKFESRDDFIDALICSCYIPFVTSKRLQRFRGKICMDGGISDNQPSPERCAFFELFKLISVSPFIGEGDIAPKSNHDYCDNAISIANQNFIPTFSNVKRFIEGLNPQGVNTIIGFAHEGYNDTEAYFRRRGKHIQRCINLNEQKSDKLAHFPLVSEPRNNFKKYLKELEDLAIGNSSKSLLYRLMDIPLKPIKYLARFYMNVGTVFVYTLCLSGNILYYPASKVAGVLDFSNYFKMGVDHKKD